MTPKIMGPNKSSEKLKFVEKIHRKNSLKKKFVIFRKIKIGRKTSSESNHIGFFYKKCANKQTTSFNRSKKSRKFGLIGSSDLDRKNSELGICETMWWSAQKCQLLLQS